MGLFALINSERAESYSNKILSVITSQYVCVVGGIIIIQIIPKILFKGKMRFLQKQHFLLDYVVIRRRTMEL